MTVPVIAIATGDPAGIGPEIGLKAATDARVRAVCRPLLVSDPGLLRRHAQACGLYADLHAVHAVDEAVWDGRRLNVFDCGQPDAANVAIGATSAAAGRAAVAFVDRAVKLALAGEVTAVAAAPQNETSIAAAGIAFDGHPSFVARATGTPEDEVFMLLCFGATRIAHATLHQSVRTAVDAITRERVARVIRVTDATLRRLGVGAPRLCVSGLNPHAGEGGLFGREEIEVIAPAIADTQREGITVSGPIGADIMFQRRDVDAFVVMLHDQGHIAAKLLAPNAAVAFTIGTPILFASVAHGSAHDIAGRGVADAKAMIDALLCLAGAETERPA